MRVSSSSIYHWGIGNERKGKPEIVVEEDERNQCKDVLGKYQGDNHMMRWKVVSLRQYVSSFMTII